MESRDSKLIADGRAWRVDGRAQALVGPSRPASGYATDFALKHPNLALHGIYVLCKIKYPIASGPPRPPAFDIQF